MKIIDNCFKSIEQIEAQLDGKCPRCDKGAFEKTGTSEVSKLKCDTCGLIIKATTVYNQNIYLMMFLVLMGGLGLVAWLMTLARFASVA